MTVFLFRKKRCRARLLLVAVCVMSVGTTCLTMHFNRQYANGEQFRRSLAVGQSLDTINDQYRYNLVSNSEMLGRGGSGLTVFSSTRSAGSMEFDELFEFSSTNTSLNKRQYAGLPELFGARYHVTTEPGNSAPLQQFTVEDTKYYITEKDACPIGYRTDRYILKEDLFRIPVDQRGLALLQASVINPEDEPAVVGAAQRFTPEEMESASSVAELVQINASGAVTGFSRDVNGFRCTASFEQDSLIYFSVPYDAGWTALIDQQKSSVIDSGGMMLLMVPAGDHAIEFQYTTPGYHAGVVISMIAILAFVLFMVIHILSDKKRQKKMADC